MRLIDPILAELEQEAATTRRVLERVPANKLGWRPHAKSMTLGQLALHVATTPAGVARIASQDVYDIQPFQQAEAKSVDELLQTLAASVSEARETVGGMDDTRLLATWSARTKGKTVMTVPRIGMLRAIMLNHWYHHRGQLVVYLRLLDVPLPSVYGPTADEDPFA